MREVSRILLLVPLDLTAEEREALITLVLAAPGSKTIIYDALACSWGVREANTGWGDLMIQVLMRDGDSRREIARRLSEILGRHVNESTIRYWGSRPGGDDA